MSKGDEVLAAAESETGSCATCRYWIQSNNYNWLGSCNIYLPPMLALTSIGTCRCDHSCSLWKEMEKTDDQTGA